MVQDLTLPTEPQDQGNLDLAPQDSEFAGEGDFQHSFILTIDDINYPATAWETVDAARFVEKRYDQGFNGGMGAFLDEQATRPNQIYTCVNLDVSTFPYIMLRKGERDQTTLALSGADTTKPVYGFVTEDAQNKEFLYIVNGTRTFKISLGTSGVDTPAFVGPTPNVAESRKTLADADAGRPVRYKGGGANSEWHVPMGPDAVAQTLTTVGPLNTNGGQISDDTWTPFTTGDNAIAFSAMTQEGVAQLWMADAINEISITRTVGTAFAPTTGFEVGDKSYAITDMFPVQGQIFVSKPDRPYRFDGQGNSIPILEFVDATGGTLTNFNGFDGANSGAHGPYAYWCHSTGLWRIFEDSAVPIDPFSQRNWSGIGLDSLTPSFNTSWIGFVAWGRWAYASNLADGVYTGWIESDGTITWLGNILSVAGTDWGGRFRIGLSTTSTNPILWVLDNNDKFAIIDLELDGSVRALVTSGTERDRGKDNEKGQVWLPSTDLGEPEKQKQMRMGWLDIDGNDATNLNIEMRVHRDRATTSTQIGSDITSGDGSGHFEFVFTPGTLDTFTEAMLAIRFDTTDTSVSASGTDIAFVDGGGGADTITQTAAGFGNFAAGDRFSVSGSTSNDGTYTIVSVVAGTITLATGTLTAEGAGQAVSIQRLFRSATASPRIRSCGMRAAMPHVYRATIPLNAEGLRGYSLGVKDALKKLRDLKSSEGVPIREPGFNGTFTGYILDVQERAQVSAGGRVDYVADVFIQRWVL